MRNFIAVGLREQAAILGYTLDQIPDGRVVVMLDGLIVEILDYDELVPWLDAQFPPVVVPTGTELADRITRLFISLTLTQVSLIVVIVTSLIRGNQ